MIYNAKCVQARLMDELMISGLVVSCNNDEDAWSSCKVYRDDR